MGGKNEFFENFERNKYLKKLPSMQRVKDTFFIPNCAFHSVFFPQNESFTIFLPKSRILRVPAPFPEYDQKRLNFSFLQNSKIYFNLL